MSFQPFQECFRQNKIRLRSGFKVTTVLLRAAPRRADRAGSGSALRGACFEVSLGIIIPQ